ncbi:alpha/beta hydrolase fold domain-containing protein [Sarocladium implicatum]|nr:alpha/beta hydrolase fold domain-containing protein [Sarocladium implicatum]
MADFSSYGPASEEWLAAEPHMPADPGEISAEVLKKGSNESREKMAAEDMKAFRDQLLVRDHDIPCRDGARIEGRSYRPLALDAEAPLPVYIHLHGGGFLIGTLSADDAICARIAIGAGVVVLNVNYRHTPEHTYPTAWNDVEDAFEWLHDHMDAVGGDPQQVVIGGISAGGTLSASLALMQNLGKAATSRPKIAGQVLMIPCLVNAYCYEPQRKKIKDASVSSYEQNRHAPILPMSRAMMFIDLLKVENKDPTNLHLNPGNASESEVRGLPPTVFGIAGRDVLRDEALLYAKMLAEAGVPTEINVFKGMPHAFRRFGKLLPRACERWDRVMVDGIKWALSKPQATGNFNVVAE